MAENDPYDPQEEAIERRRLLIVLSVGLGAIGASAAVVPLLGFVTAPARRPPGPVWRTVGRLDEFPVGRTVKVVYTEAEADPWGQKAAQTAAWLRREADGSVAVISSYCTHVGCPVRWSEGSKLFLCPCHGGAFYRDGSVAAGPPPRPLDRYDVRIEEGLVQIRTQPIPIAS